MKCPYCDQVIAKIPLTKNMQIVFDFIKNYIDTNNGLSPSYENIMEGTIFKSKSNVARYILSLENRGWITKTMYKKRTLIVL